MSKYLAGIMDKDNLSHYISTLEDSLDNYVLLIFSAPHL